MTTTTLHLDVDATFAAMLPGLAPEPRYSHTTYPAIVARWDAEYAARVARTDTATLVRAETDHSRAVTAHWTEVHDERLDARRAAIYAHRTATQALVLDSDPKAGA